MATLLSLVQQFCGKQGLPVPTDVVGSTDAGVVQIRRLLEEECAALANRGAWQALTNECTFLTLAAESQGSISAGLGSGPTALSGYRYIVPAQVMYNRTQRIPVLGALNAQDWQYLKSITAAGPWAQYRWRGDQLLFNPAPAAGQTVAFEYLTEFWGLTGTTPMKLFVTNDDTIRLTDEIVLKGLEWRWLKKKGFAYAEDFNSYEDLVKDQLSREKGSRTLNLGEHVAGLRPAVVVPLWNAIPP
jgi:hypothetical protein